MAIMPGVSINNGGSDNLQPPATVIRYPVEASSALVEVNFAAWSAGLAYPEGQFIAYGGNLYIAPAEISAATAFNPSQWTLVVAGGSGDGSVSTGWDPAGSAATAQASSLQKSSNLGDLTSPAQAVDNLGLGSIVTQMQTLTGQVTSALTAASGASATAAVTLASVTNLQGSVTTLANQVSSVQASVVSDTSTIATLQAQVAALQLLVSQLEAAPVITSGPPPAAAVGANYQMVFTATGEDPTFALASGSFPPGLALDSSTGVLSGVPTATGTYTFTITATDTAGSLTTPPLSITVSTAAVPVNTSAPIISGVTTVGQTLSATTGTWTNSPTYAYQWNRNGAAIAGATGSTYLLATADLGEALSVTVTATNIAGSASATSPSTATVVAASIPPSFTADTPVAGVIGTAYSYTLGTAGTAPITLALVSGSLPAGLALSGAVISGVPTTSGTSTFAVQASNVAGTFTATNLTITISSNVSVPTNTALPVISGAAIVGDTLTATTGTWSHNPTAYAYTFNRGGAPIAGATNLLSNSYTLATADAGSTITVTVTASNTAGAATATSLPTGAVGTAPAAPINTSLPTITGTAVVGDVLTASLGGWSGSPTSYAYQWNRGGVAITNAASATYTVVIADANNPLSVTVTATNTQGASSATSLATAAVVAAPVNTSTPTISGTAVVGNTLTVTSGVWSNTPSQYAFQWKQNGTAITGASTTAYLLQSADASQVITATVTATNAAGSVAATSNSITVSGTGTVTPPVNTATPVISDSNSGTVMTGVAPSVGEILTVSTGTWQANALPDMVVTSLAVVPASPAAGQACTFTCVVDNVGTGPTPSGTITAVAFKAATTPSGTVGVVATSDTYTTAIAAGATVSVASDTGQTWTPSVAGTYTVSATVNPGGLYSEVSTSNNTATITITVVAASPPTNTGLPVISDSNSGTVMTGVAPSVGEILTVSTGTWS